MPLLNICGVTNMNKTFTIAAAFLDNETEDQYSWVIETLITMINRHGIRLPKVIITDRELALIKAIQHPQLQFSTSFLCRWHINKNVLAKCKPMFPKASKVGNAVIRDKTFKQFLQDWGKLIDSTDKAIFNKRLEAFKKAHPFIPVDYTLRTWINPWKEKFVKYLVDQVRHFGHTTTSVIEGLHSSMKEFLASSAGDFYTAFSRFRTFWLHQGLQVTAKHIRSEDEVPSFTNKPLYQNIRFKVSNFALNRIIDEHRKVDEKIKKKKKPEIANCSCTLKLAWGLPCEHIIHHRIQSQQPIQLTEIDPHWYIKTIAKEPRRDVPHDPSQVKSKGRPRGSDNLAKASTSKSTRRQPSYFEVVEAQERQEASRIMPSSTAPAVMTSTSSKRGIEYLEEEGDAYEPGTEHPRGAQRARCRTPSTPSTPSNHEDDAEHESYTDTQWARLYYEQGWARLEAQLEEELEAEKGTQDCIEVAAMRLE